MPLTLLYGPFRQNPATRASIYLREDGEYIVSEQVLGNPEQIEEFPTPPINIAVGLRRLNAPLEVYEQVFRDKAQAIFWFHFAPNIPMMFDHVDLRGW